MTFQISETMVVPLHLPLRLFVLQWDRVVVVLAVRRVGVAGSAGPGSFGDHAHHTLDECAGACTGLLPHRW